MASYLAILNMIPSWLWKMSFGAIAKKYKKAFGPHLEWEVWDAPIHGGESEAVVVFRVTNLSPKELKCVSLSLEIDIGDIKEASMYIGPLWPICGRRHLDQLAFNEIDVFSKPRRRTIEFDLPPKSDWRIEVSLPFACIESSPLALLKHYEFSCQRQR